MALIRLAMRLSQNIAMIFYLLTVLRLILQQECDMPMMLGVLSLTYKVALQPEKQFMIRPVMSQQVKRHERLVIH